MSHVCAVAPVTCNTLTEQFEKRILVIAVYEMPAAVQSNTAP